MTFKDIILVGDVHGMWYTISDHIDDYSIKDTCYIQVGDFNIGYAPISIDIANLINLNNILLESNNKLLIIRGNHDDPHWFKSFSYIEEKSKLSNISFIEDYSVLEINNENFLFIGGAISIDRSYSKMVGQKWWEDEIVKFNYDKISSLTNIDRVISHTSPDIAFPRTFNGLVYKYALNDSHLLDDLRVERSEFGKIFSKLKEKNNIKGLYYGHFHSSSYEEIENCEFRCLGVCEFYRL